MTSNLSVLLKKYSVPVIFFVLGLFILIFGAMNGQGTMFMMASVLMFVAGALSIIYSTGSIKSGMVYIFGIAAGIAGIVTLIMSYQSVNDTATYNANYKQCKSQAKQNLEDIRFIQKAYASENGKYIGDWDELIDFAKNGTIPFVDAQGVVPSRKITPEENKFLYTNNPPIDNNMTEKEAFLLSKWKEGPNWEKDFKSFKRDTVRVSLYKSKFEGKAYVESREKAGFKRFSADSLPYIPFTGGKKKWTLEIKDSVQVGETFYPAIHVSGMIPFADIQGKNDDQEEMSFGSLTTNDTSGSWENE